MEHAHPLPDGSYTPSRQSARLSYTSGVTQSSPKNVNSSPRPYEILNPQTRILQMRNAGFRGPVISGRRISPGNAPSLHESHRRPTNDENSPRTSERRILYGEELPPNPVNILQEIHKSTRRRHNSPKTGFGAIFQDNTSELAAQEAGGVSWYTEDSSIRSPSPSNRGPVKMMKLRERTLNETTPPPLSSPLAKQVKSRKMNHLNLRSASFEASKYIEHLESQLTALHAKVDSLMSPATNRARSAKLRALTAEARSLRQELSDWEKKFEDRVEEEIHGRTEYETGMRSRIQSLESEMEIKDSKLRELEWEIEGMRNKAKEAEGLEEANMNLERRIDVLTSLVVQSPTKVDLYSPSPSPNKTDQLKQIPRPKSLLAKVPSSPGGVRLSLNTKIEAASWDSKRFVSTSSISVSPGGASNSIEEEEEDENSSDPIFREIPARPLSCASASFRSLPSFPTRPTLTNSALELRTPEMRFSADFDSQTRSANRQRRMRRFPSGSCSLKPLILPNAAITPPLPASAPLYMDSEGQRNVSGVSLDPTIAFLSKMDDNSSICTPTQPSRQRSATWAQEESPNAPEKTSKPLEESHRDSLRRSFVLPSNDVLDTLCEVPIQQQKSKRPRPLSLDKELELANFLSPNQFEDGLIAADAEDETRFESIPIGIETSHSKTSLPNSGLRHRKSGQPNLIPHIRGEQEVFITPTKNILSTGITNQNAFGIFTRLTSLIARVNQDPIVLARRLLCNAWNIGAVRLGGIGWWLLGPVFRSHGLRGLSAADRKTVEEQSSNMFNWRHFSAQASRRRTAEHAFRNQAELAYTNNCELDFREMSKIRGISGSTSLSSSIISPSSPSATKPRLFPCDECVESSGRQSFRLWFKFSLAIVLAVGVAIKHGPGSLLADHNSHVFHAYHEPESDIHKEDVPSMTCSSQSTKVGSSRKASGDAEIESGRRAEGEDVVFAEILGPKDFENRAQVNILYPCD